MADPDHPRSLDDAITVVGICQDMCPEFERVERMVERTVQGPEMVRGQCLEEVQELAFIQHRIRIPSILAGLAKFRTRVEWSRNFVAPQPAWGSSFRQIYALL